METKTKAEEAMIEEFWIHWNTIGPPKGKVRQRRFFRMLPTDKRCKFCYAPLAGSSGTFVKTVFQVSPSRYNPFYCNMCDDFAAKYQGGAEVMLTMFFADMRGSTAIAEKIGAKEFSALINRFYVTAVHVLSHADAMIEKLVGDEVTAMFSPGIAGPEYTRRAIEAGKELLRATGNVEGEEPWIPVGIGIHAGKTFVGSVGKPDGIMEVAALGDVPNTAARLTSLAGPGEILVSESTFMTTGMNPDGLEKRCLELKGRSKQVDVFVLHP